MRVSDVLKSNRQTLATCIPEESIATLCTRMSSLNIGAFPVCDAHGALVGIISERDIVHALAHHGPSLLSLTVAEVMTRPVVTCEPTQSVGELMAEMTNRRIRHFPVVRNGRLCGIVSIGDVVKNRLDEIEYEAKSLRSFIAGG